MPKLTERGVKLPLKHCHVDLRVNLPCKMLHKLPDQPENGGLAQLRPSWCDSLGPAYRQMLVGVAFR